MANEELASSISYVLIEHTKLLEKQSAVKELVSVFTEAANQLDVDLQEMENELQNPHTLRPINTDQAKEHLQQTDSLIVRVNKSENQLHGVQVG